jgi:drug/metabolite transporter (DMT)-like permease
MNIRLGPGQRWALVAALSYTIVNITLRAAAPKIDPFLGSMLRQIPVAMLAWGVVISTGRREFWPRDPAFLGWRFVAALVAGGFISFLVGNVFFFQALNDGGLGITVNAVQGGSVFAGIGLAFLVLRERPRGEQVAGAVVIAFGLALVAVAQLGTPRELWALGLVFALLAGTSYATSNVVTRMVQRRRPILFVTLAGTSFGGIIPLTIVVLARAGWDPAHAFGSLDLSTLTAVLAAGCFNAVALIGLTQAMKYADVTTTTTTSSAQIVFSFLGSVLLFGESGSPTMILGVILVVVGIVIAQLNRTRRAARAAAPAAGAESTATSGAGTAHAVEPETGTVEPETGTVEPPIATAGAGAAEPPAATTGAGASK